MNLFHYSINKNIFSGIKNPAGWRGWDLFETVLELAAWGIVGMEQMVRFLTQRRS
jgi:hypothetical protein